MDKSEYALGCECGCCLSGVKCHCDCKCPYCVRLGSGGEIELGASTPLMEASQEGHLNIVRYLIEKGANIHAETSTGDSALTYACANGHTIIADILMQCGADLVSW